MRGDARFLLLQARVPNDPMGRHEHRCFAQTLGVPLERIECWDLLRGPPDEAALRRTDLILVGGSGSFSVCDGEPFIKQYIDFLADVCVARDFPTFASCFGFQGLVVAGGGEVVRDPARAEVGTYDIFVTEQGRRDPLLAGLFPSFLAQQGHRDRASRLPAGFSHLARSERVPYQAVRVDHGPVFATQFHPELDRDANTLRYLRYQAGYEGGADAPADHVLSIMRDSPRAGALLRRWADAALATGPVRTAFRP